MSRDREAAFNTLAARVSPSILGYLVRRTTPRADAADLLAEVLTIAWRRFEDLPHDDEEAVRWLFGVARGVLANHRRGESRRVALADRLRDHLATTVPDHAPVTAEMLSLQAALDELSDDDRELLQLIAWEGLSSVEAAGVLGIQPAAVRQRLFRARERLRDHLAAPIEPSKRADR